jgi:hypothetical protein
VTSVPSAGQLLSDVVAATNTTTITVGVKVRLWCFFFVFFFFFFFASVDVLRCVGRARLLFRRHLTRCRVIPSMIVFLTINKRHGQRDWHGALVHGLQIQHRRSGEVGHQRRHHEGQELRKPLSLSLWTIRLHNLSRLHDSNRNLSNKTNNRRRTNDLSGVDKSANAVVWARQSRVLRGAQYFVVVSLSSFHFISLVLVA